MGPLVRVLASKAFFTAKARRRFGNLLFASFVISVASW
jgi:hypothetical protein